MEAGAVVGGLPRLHRSTAQTLAPHGALLPRLLAPGALFILGHTKRDTLDIPPAWKERKTLKHGDTVIRFFKPAGAVDPVEIVEPGPTEGEPTEP